MSEIIKELEQILRETREKVHNAKIHRDSALSLARTLDDHIKWLNADIKKTDQLLKLEYRSRGYST